MQPVDDVEYHARLARLRGFTAMFSEQPTLDGDRRLVRGNQWVALSEKQELLVACLISAPGHDVSEEALLAAGWPTGRPVPNTFRTAMRRLRQRVEQVGLDLRRTRSGRWLVEDAAPRPIG